MALLKFSNITISRSHAGQCPAPVVSHFNCRLAAGHIHFFLGPNGCGKTSLVKAVMHLHSLRRFQVQGAIDLLDQPIWRNGVVFDSTDRLRRFLLKHVGYITQNAYAALDPGLTLAQSFAEKETRLGQVAAADRAATIFRDLLAPAERAQGRWRRMLDRRPGRLSGGQRQLANIALSLSGRPALVIADEGFDSIDFSRLQGVLQFLIEQVRCHGATLLLTCHSYALIYQIQQMLADEPSAGASIQVHEFEAGFAARMQQAFARTRQQLQARWARPPAPVDAGDGRLRVHRFATRPGQIYPRSPFCLQLDQDLHIPAGAVVGLIGASGSGKSTFAQLMARAAIKTTPRLKPAPGRVQYSFQAPYPCFNPRRAPWRMLAEGRNGDRSRQADPAAVLVDHLDGAALIRRRPELQRQSGIYLSGGELQKLCLGRAIAWQPQFLLLDEPFSHLDVTAAGGLQRLFQARASRRGAIFLIMHDLCLALVLCDFLIMVADGRIGAADHVGNVLAHLRRTCCPAVDDGPWAALQSAMAIFGAAGADA